jgi:hypothetical protein
MKKKFMSLAAFVIAASIFSCQNEGPATSANEISPDVLNKISALGFSTAGVQLVDGGYLVEGDILLHDHDLVGNADRKALRIAEVEQYNTFNLVNAGTGRTVRVSINGSPSSAFTNAVAAAIDRYNKETLKLTFQLVSSGGDIVIRIVNTGQYIASAGFPDSNGNPYPEVKYAKKYTNYSAGFMTTVIAHELGHCIGFRHTDYMNRSYSCGSGGNEGQVTTGVGAVHIPGTPTGPDAASWMLACLSASTDRPFNSNDKVALDYLY